VDRLHFSFSLRGETGYSADLRQPGNAMRKLLKALLLASLFGGAVPAAHAQSGGDVSVTPNSVTYPPYRIRYLADIIERDEGRDRLIEEGVFDTRGQADEVINILAHLRIAWSVDCVCEEYRRDVIGASSLEDRLMIMLRDYGYVSRLVPSSEVGSLPTFVGVLTPYLTLPGDGYRDDYSGSGLGGTSTTLNPNDPRQYARVDHLGIFVDSRLSSFLLSRVSQVMSGYLIDDPVSLCAFAALDRSPDDMLSWVLIRDLRKTWPGEETIE
jgi:hypothetical protein